MGKSKSKPRSNNSHSGARPRKALQDSCQPGAAALAGSPSPLVAASPYLVSTHKGDGRGCPKTFTDSPASGALSRCPPARRAWGSFLCLLTVGNSNTPAVYCHSISSQTGYSHPDNSKCETRCFQLLQCKRRTGVPPLEYISSPLMTTVY